MCGRFTSTSPIEVLAETFEVDEIRAEPSEPRYNVAPTQEVLAVATRRPRPSGDRTPADAGAIRALGQFRWGLIPSWATDLSVASRMINARAETVAAKPAYRKAMITRRCLIPADAFYEWQARPGCRSKQPWAIRLASGQPMAFAGLWEVWRDRRHPDTPPVRSCVIITTAANSALSDIHDRMPVVLAPDTWTTWLDPTNEDHDGLHALLRAAPDDWFETTTVSPAVNAVTNDGPELIRPTPAEA